MACYQTDYQSLSSLHEDPDTPPDNDVIFHVPPEKSRWNHIEDLDSFFRKVYRYHQKHGFLCIITNEFYALLQFIFIVFFTVYISNCVDYDAVGRQVSFQNATYTEKLKISDLLFPASVCVKRLGTFTWICVIVAMIFWVYYLCRTIYCTISFYEIKLFYNSALKIPCCELNNTTWHEVQCRLREVQQEQQMCIHKQELTELDIYHRILRHENYLIAMMNKNILPLKYNLPLIGEMVYFPSGLRFNIELLLFRSPFSPFKSTWQLKDDYKKFNKRSEIAQRLSKAFMLLGIANLLLCPFIFLWQLLSFCVNYAGHIRKEPSFLGTRKWSQYSRLYLRHFNELEHELTARLNRAYNPSCSYIDSFSSPLIAIHARNSAQIGGVVALYIIVWGAIQNQILETDHILTIAAVATFVCHFSLTSVPNPNVVFVPKRQLTRILGDIHYMPDTWKDKEHTHTVRNEFSQFFQLKVSHIFEQILSPILSPLVLIFYLRHRSLDIVDFFRSFTVEVAGVGDVCSFALMDISRHGNYQWIEEIQTNADQFQQAENGKTELSLVHFTMTNPYWQPPHSSNIFINNLRQQAQREFSELPEASETNLLQSSLNSLHGFKDTHSLYSEKFNNRLRCNQGLDSSMLASQNVQPATGQQSTVQQPAVCGAVSLSEGPLHSQTGIFSSLRTSPGGDDNCIQQPTSNASLNPMEYRAAEMSLSALYLHEIHYKRLRSLRHPGSSFVPPSIPTQEQEQEEEDDEDEEIPGNELRRLLS